MPFFGTDESTGKNYRYEIMDGALAQAAEVARIPENVLTMPFYETEAATGKLYCISIIDGVLAVQESPIAGALGYSPQQIIEMAQKRTERRGKTLDLPAELTIVAQELCQEHRWHWRKKSIVVTTVAGTAVYNLGAQLGMAGLTCERVCREGPKLFRGMTDHACLSAIFETDCQEIAREDDSEGSPGQYFIDGQDQIRFVKVPDAEYKVRVPAWVLPDDSPMQSEVRLVPPHLHHILIKGLEARIFRFTLGEGAAKYQAAVAEYQNAVAKASISTDFADGRIREWKQLDEEAIRST